MIFKPLSALISCTLLLVASTQQKADKSEDKSQLSKMNRISIGGAPVVTLQVPHSAAANTQQFLSVRVLPGRGMNVFQIKASLPGRGEVNLLSAPSLEEASKILNGGEEDFNGNKSFSLGGAILVPYANRIRGKLSPDGKSLQTAIAGKPLNLPANWQGKKPGAERHAMHGLILNSKFEDVNVSNGVSEAHVAATLHAGDFSGHWLSSTDLAVQVSLQSSAVELVVTAKNAGKEMSPIGIGWHPYFVFPSGIRQQARLHIPAKQRALVNNYDNVFPTGKLIPVAGTAYDFSHENGSALKNQFLDDTFVNLERQGDGSVVAEIMDPAANYGLRVIALSKEVAAFQVYAPPEKDFVALEPQFNYGDPYGKQWGKTKTGMVNLQPGASVTYRVRLELFQPNESNRRTKQ